MLDALHPQPPKPAHKDKLADKKKHEDEIHELLKQQQHQEKDKQKQEHHDVAKAYKEIRAIQMDADPDQKHSKRAVKEAREAQKKAEKEEGQQCEHGVWKCKICFPHKHTKEQTHGHERPADTSGIVPEDDT